MPPISRSEYLYRLPLLERFISLRLLLPFGVQRDRQRTARRHAPGVGLGRRPLGLVMPGGVGLSISLLRRDIRAHVGALYTYRSACTRCHDGPRCRSGAKRHVNHETPSSGGFCRKTEVGSGGLLQFLNARPCGARRRPSRHTRAGRRAPRHVCTERHIGRGIRGCARGPRRLWWEAALAVPLPARGALGAGSHPWPRRPYTRRARF